MKKITIESEILLFLISNKIRLIGVYNERLEERYTLFFE